MLWHIINEPASVSTCIPLFPSLPPPPWLSVSAPSLLAQSERHGKYAEYLIIFCDGDFRNTVGMWKRYSDFVDLSRRVVSGCTDACRTAVTGPGPIADDAEAEVLPNARASW